MQCSCCGGKHSAESKTEAGRAGPWIVGRPHLAAALVQPRPQGRPRELRRLLRHHGPAAAARYKLLESAVAAAHSPHEPLHVSGGSAAATTAAAASAAAPVAAATAEEGGHPRCELDVRGREGGGAHRLPQELPPDEGRPVDFEYVRGAQHGADEPPEELEAGEVRR